MSQPKPIRRKNRVARYALVAAVAAALSLPLVSQHLRAQDERAPGSPPPPPPAGAAAPKAKPVTAAPKVDPATVVASAGDVKVTAGEFEAFLAGLQPQQQQQITGDPEGKRQLADHLLRMKAMAREAEKRKLDQDPKVKEQIDTVTKALEAQKANARQQVLVQALVMGMQGDEASDKKFFQENLDKFGKVQARHILVSTRGSNDASNPKEALTDAAAKKKADDIRARLVKGEDFAKIAAAESDDPGSKDKGGEYTFGRGEMVPAFEQAAFGMKDNEISQPIKTPFGYHVIQTLKRLPGSFEESRETIVPQRIEAMVKQVLGGEPTFNESYLGGTPAAAPAAAPKAPAKDGKK